MLNSCVGNAQLTEQLAARLIKSRARHFIYSERARTTHNSALENIAALEGELVREAERAWRLAIAQGQHADRRALTTILTRAKNRARREVRVAFDDSTTTESLAKFFDSFQPEDLIPTEGTS